MSGFIQVEDNYETPQLIAVDQISQVLTYDKYHPNEKAIIVLKDGTVVQTSWRYTVASIRDQIAEATVVT